MVGADTMYAAPMSRNATPTCPCPIPASDLAWGSSIDSMKPYPNWVTATSASGSQIEGDLEIQM